MVDRNNIRAIDQLILYATRSKDFDGDLNKGICMAGPKGTGKSVLMKTLGRIMPAKEQFKMVSMVKMELDYRKMGASVFDEFNSPTMQLPGSYNLGPAKPNNVCGNDLAREPRESIYMGGREDVGATFVYLRYDLFQDFGTKTHFTTNMQTKEEFEARYGDLNYDRIIEMCNIIFLRGDSRRPDEPKTNNNN